MVAHPKNARSDGLKCPDVGSWAETKYRSAKASVLRRVTTTTFLHSRFFIRSCTMRPPTLPVAPSTIAEYCAFVSAAAVYHRHLTCERMSFCWVGRFLRIISTFAFIL